MNKSILDITSKQGKNFKLKKEDPRGTSLYLDGRLHFTQIDKERYYESLVLPAVLSSTALNVLVLGGASGVVAEYLLLFDFIKSIDIVDDYYFMYEHAKSNNYFLNINQGSLLSDKVNCIKSNIVDFFKENSKKYDLIISDLPDPISVDDMYYYSCDFYFLLKSKMTSKAVFVTQACSAYGIFAEAYRNLSNVFQYKQPYYIHSYLCHNITYIITSANEIRFKRDLPCSFDFINEKTIKTIFNLSQDKKKLLEEPLSFPEKRDIGISLKDKSSIVWEAKSDYQKIELFDIKESGLVLFLDQHIQFAQYDEFIYHEGLGVFPMLYGKQISKVLICGGGDGLLTRELLRFDEIKKIKVVELDPEMIKMTNECPQLNDLCCNSFKDKRVEVTVGDAYEYILSTSDKYDLIICDFPDAHFKEINKLYSKTFYEHCYSALSDRGLLCVQSCFVPGMFPVIRDTISSVFKDVLSYRFHSRSFFCSGYNLAVKKGKLKKYKKVPDFCKFLNEKILQSGFVFFNDEQSWLSKNYGINSVENNLLIIKSFLSSYLSMLYYPYGDDIVYLDSVYFTKDISDPYILKYYLDIISEQKHIVFYVPDSFVTLTDFLFKENFYLSHNLTLMEIEWNDESFEKMEEIKAKCLLDNQDLNLQAIKGCASLNKNLKYLLSQYLRKHGKMFCDGLGDVSKVMQDEASYYLYERNGKPVGFNKVIQKDNIREGEITYSEGSSRDSVFMLLDTFLREASSHMGEVFYVYVPYENVISLLKKIGFKVKIVQNVMIKERVLV